MAFQRKVDRLRTLDGDVVVVQECSKASVDSLNGTADLSTAWFGSNLNKGLGILARAPWRIRQADPMDMNLIAKAELTGPADLDLYAVWACKSNGVGRDYIGQVHRLLDHIESRHPRTRMIVAGDFNSNTIWDHEHGSKSHSEAVRRFKILGLDSAYHRATGEAHGAEKQATIYFRKSKAAPYHIDYAFLSEALLDGLRSVTVGTYEDWISLSDHAPVLVDFDLSK